MKFENHEISAGFAMRYTAFEMKPMVRKSLPRVVELLNDRGKSLLRLEEAVTLAARHAREKNVRVIVVEYRVDVKNGEIRKGGPVWDSRNMLPWE